MNENIAAVPDFESRKQITPNSNRQVLDAVVRIATGSDKHSPRPGQIALLNDIDKALATNTHAVGEAPTGVGKALDVSTPIPTPSGWKLMGDLVIGDEVFDENGVVCSVTHAHEVRSDRACYELVFSDGTRIVADGEHLWPTATRALRFDQAERRRNESRPRSVRTLQRLNKVKELRDECATVGSKMTLKEAYEVTAGLIDKTQINKTRRALDGFDLSPGERFDLLPVLDDYIARVERRTAPAAALPAEYEVQTTAEMALNVHVDGALNHAVPVAGPLQLGEVTLPIAPYTLGAWLGDGSSHGGQITSNDVEIVEQIRSDGYFVKKLAAQYLYGISLTKIPANNKWVDSFTKQLGEVGVRNNKHIPVAYLRASFDQRLALMQGLMDTDGTVDKRGQSEFSVTCEPLARDFFDLAISLGIRATFKTSKATLTRKDGTRLDCGVRYRIHFSTDLPVFRLQRKAGRIKTCGDEKRRRRYVESIERVESRPVRCITVDSPSHLFLASEAMIPTHNSFAYLVPAAVAVIERGERSVISTESLALQSQIMDKDGPTVSQACLEVLGDKPKIAVLKGWANYACHNRSYHQAIALLDEMGLTPSGTGIPDLLVVLRELADDLGVGTAAPAEDKLRVEDNLYTLAEVVPLLIWALQQTGLQTGDKHSYEGHAPERSWNAVAVSTNECVGLDVCPFADVCRPAIAREIAAEADIVVTNHSMLAVQAANDAPVVIGNSKLGRFDHILIDEAHTLPSAVRDQGSTEISARKIRGVINSLNAVFDEGSKEHRKLIEGGNLLAEVLDRHLDIETVGLTPGGVKRLGEDDNPVESFAQPMLDWLKRINKELTSIVEFGGSNVSLKARRAKSIVAGQTAAVRSVAEDRPGTARWIELTRPFTGAKNPRSWSVVRATPVDVAPMLNWNLWTAPDPEMTDIEYVDGEPDNDKDTQPRYNLSVVALSATLPQGFGGQIGLKARTKQYESPFEKAYANSMLYIPRAVDQSDIDELCPNSSQSSKPRLDTKAHITWATKHIIELVNANGGSALVLAATAAAGKAYAAALKEQANGYTVMSQWDGDALRRTTISWREDHHAVLVGTRSLMTGVDAPGDTCSLVIVDRIPRAAGNPVDDARVDGVKERLQIDKWAADRLVYALDAALLLEQASGRLIRSISDTGMVAVLDPRLLKTGPLAYNNQTRTVYLEALGRFTQRASRAPEAVAFLQGRNSSKAA